MHELDCDVDVHGLRAYLEVHGDERVGASGQTRRQAVSRLLKQARRVSEGVARIRLRYYHSEVGRNLKEAGHYHGKP